MIYKEIIFHFKDSKIITTFLICQATLYLVLLGTFLSLTSELNCGKNNLEEIYENKSIYHLLDGYFDPDEFSEFRNRPDALAIIKKYYNELNSANSFKYLAMFNQGIAINTKALENIGSTARNDLKSNNDASYMNVNSFQINLQASDYFLLNVSLGRKFVSGDFADGSGSIPILIGSNYANSFAVGDEINAMFYQKEVTLRVVGILAENSFVYFNGDPEFYLDNFFVLPYIDYGSPESEFDRQFQEIVYFAMINGYISTKSDNESATEMMAELESIAQRTGFYNYLFVGSDPDLQPYRGLINVMNANNNLVKTIFSFSFLLNAVTMSLLIYFEQRRRLSAFAIHYLHGASFSTLNKQLLCEVFLIMLLSFFFSQIVLSSILRINNTLSQIVLFIVVVVLAAAVSIWPIINIARKPLAVLLNNEEERL